jgi:hypothetical protein
MRLDPQELEKSPSPMVLVWLYRHFTVSEWKHFHMMFDILTGANIRECFRLNPRFIF